MKIKNILKYLAGIPVVILMLVILVPLGALYFLYKILTMPFSYIRHKRSLYQKDFPCRYSIWRYPHHDEKVYTVIKKNDLPIAYIKGQKEYEQYEMPGYFVYKDILLDFNELFFFDPERGLWLTELETASEEEQPSDEDSESTEHCLTVDEGKKRYLEDFRRDVPDYVCNRVVMFYLRGHVERGYNKGGLDRMRSLGDFVVYEKGELATAIQNFVKENSVI